MEKDWYEVSNVVLVAKPYFQIAQTNEQVHPWIQLDMGEVYDIVEVFFETYDENSTETYRVRAGENALN